MIWLTLAMVLYQRCLVIFVLYRLVLNAMSTQSVLPFAACKGKRTRSGVNITICAKNASMNMFRLLKKRTIQGNASGAVSALTV
ncbi:hypothetical protein C5T94_20315 [Raoultella ornithinolytica]|nr:hypothetical protein C5T92_19315 [Raoultella ornithinolytica]PQH35700.1 hypothetical protein C5T94_20315 [Raoultella ornithinolytica]